MTRACCATDNEARTKATAPARRDKNRRLKPSCEMLLRGLLGVCSMEGLGHSWPTEETLDFREAPS
jgi:hypothetical protein